MNQKDPAAKRPCTSFLPYRMRGNEFEFYLQMRDSAAAVLPNMLALFGGGVDAGETVEQGFLREVQEELSITPKNYRYFSHYECAAAVADVFVAQVTEHFETTVTVCEGEYGIFLTYDEMLERAKEVSPLTLTIVRDLLEDVQKV